MNSLPIYTWIFKWSSNWSKMSPISEKMNTEWNLNSQTGRHTKSQTQVHNSIKALTLNRPIMNHTIDFKPNQAIDQTSNTPTCTDTNSKHLHNIDLGCHWCKDYSFLHTQKISEKGFLNRPRRWRNAFVDWTIQKGEIIPEKCKGGNFGLRIGYIMNLFKKGNKCHA